MPLFSLLTLPAGLSGAASSGAVLLLYQAGHVANGSVLPWHGGGKGCEVENPPGIMYTSGCSPTAVFRMLFPKTGTSFWGIMSVLTMSVRQNGFFAPGHPGCSVCLFFPCGLLKPRRNKVAPCFVLPWALKSRFVLRAAVPFFSGFNRSNFSPKGGCTWQTG